MWAITTAVGGILGLVVLYLKFVRPRQLRWGAEDAEVALTLPGDDLVPDPDFNATRAINIAAPPEEVWKWIIQIGSGRAGWYSLDWIDNGGVKSATALLPEFQRIEVGRFIPFTRDQKNGMWVKSYQENGYILWVDKEGKATWLWHLRPAGAHGCRLLTRLRTRYVWKGVWILYYLLYDMGDIVMMRSCLRGIKERAERRK